MDILSTDFVAWVYGLVVLLNVKQYLKRVYKLSDAKISRYIPKAAGKSEKQVIRSSVLYSDEVMQSFKGNMDKATQFELLKKVILYY